MSDSDDPISPIDEGDDLFGDGDADEEIGNDDAPQSNERAATPADEGASDEELVPMDEDREEQEPKEFREKIVLECPLYRHRIPKSKVNDGNIQSLKVPKFIKLNPQEYIADTWEPSEWELENATKEKPLPEVLFRRDPKTGKSQSNTNICKWSDGSMTIAIGDEHYEIQSKPLAPKPDKPYQEVQDAHYYAAAAHLTTNSLVIVGHFSEQYAIRPNKEITDDAVERLKAKLAAEKKDRGDLIISTKEDPELQKKQAELAEKERNRAQRRRENAAARLEGLGGSGGGGFGGRSSKGGALSIGDLETGRGRGGPGGKKRGAPGGGKKKHRRPEYDSDDELPQGARRQADNYDMDDGFVVDSGDEVSEEVEDDDEEDELEDDDEEEEEAPRRAKRQKTADAEDEDANGEADLDDVDAPTHGENSRHRRRNVVEDDDDE